ncbi:hypothetical protein EDB95_3232 [Dinghuibacter silviterrae]|uniref:Uncharacterized protein n=1 Tax=Dinghuibacter silviterrae TaxID=1539049 RepID=A0A4R8DY86_9BACT|nr:hypothetical protein EDB95_3232 [Dinghuibacter silviterrae]
MDEYSPEMFRPERVQERLKAQGIHITNEQAAQVVELLERLSTIIISQQLRQCK